MCLALNGPSQLMSPPQFVGHSWIQQVELSRHLLLAERFTKGVVKTAKTAERLIIAKQIPDPRMLFRRRRNHHQ